MKIPKEVFIALILGLAILGYGAISYLAKIKVLEFEKEKAVQQQQLEDERIKLEEKQRNAKEKNFFGCINTASENKDSSWNVNCRNLGKNDDCKLPGNVAESLLKQYQQNQEMCNKLYGE